MPFTPPSFECPRSDIRVEESSWREPALNDVSAGPLAAQRNAAPVARFDGD